MYLIEDYSHVKKHLKIEHIFSAKKYPIYYSYDQQTFQTSLTKVINNKNAQIINYYKYHINEHILPYLKMKSSSSKPSNLRLSQDNPEIMIKINQIEKEKNMKKLRGKIDGHLLQLRIFKWIKKFEFKKELESMEQFIKRIDKSSEQIQRIINEVQSSIISICELHKQFSMQQIASQISQRLDLQKEGKEEIEAIEKLKLFNSLSEFQAQKQRIVWQQIKSDRSQQMKKMIEAFSEAIHSCISNLSIQENYLNLQEIYQMLKQDQKNLIEQQKKIYEANVLYINRKFIKGTTLRQMILSKDKRITQLFCRDLSKNIVDFILRDGGIKNLFITSQNIIVEDFGKFHINYFSFVGLQFVKLQKYVSKRELQQILPYLTSNYIDSKNPNRQMDLQIYLRFIILNFISAYFNKDIVYSYQKVDFQVQVRRDRVEDIIKRINSDLLPEILTIEDMKDIAQKFDKTYMVNYTKLVEFIFVKESKETLTWEYILSLLGCTMSLDRFSSISAEQITFNEIGNSLLKYLANPSAKCFDWLSINIFQVVDHFIDILEYFIENTDKILNVNDKKVDKQSQKSKLAFSSKRQLFQKKNLQIKLQKIKKLSKQLSTQRSYFKNRDRYYHILYLPIKCRFTFCKILDYHNWMGLLVGQKYPHQQTYIGAQNLFSFLLQMQQAMIFLQPYITDETILKTLDKKSNSNIKSTKQRNTYGHILRNFKKNQRQYKNSQQDINLADYSDDNEGNQERMEFNLSIKDATLKYFFQSTKIVFNILKYYFRNMNEISVAGDLKIHYGLAKTFDSFIPYEYIHNKKDDLKEKGQ